MVALLLFIMSYFGDRFWPKKLLEGKRTFDDYVFKNPARYIQLKICYYITRHIWYPRKDTIDILNKFCYG